MKLSDIPTAELRDSVKAAEQILGPRAQTVVILRRELDRRTITQGRAETQGVTK